MGRWLEDQPRVTEDEEAKWQLRRLWLSVMPLYKDPATAGTSSPGTLANTPDRRAQVDRGEAFAAERARLEKQGLSPSEVLAALEAWLTDRGLGRLVDLTAREAARRFNEANEEGGSTVPRKTTTQGGSA